MPMDVVTLKSGVRVVNLVEEKPVLLDTGEILPACDSIRSHEWSTCIREVKYDYEPWEDVELKPYLSIPVREFFFRVDWDIFDIALVPAHIRRAVVEEYRRQSPSAPWWLDQALKKTRMALSDTKTGTVSASRFLL